MFTDLDGSLLDHDNYDYSPAIPTLQRLKRHNIPLILCTSKTRTEIIAMQQRLEIVQPAAVENGAAVIIPTGYFARRPSGAFIESGNWIKRFGKKREEILSKLKQLGHDFPGCFRSFTAMGVAGIAEDSGLSLEGAQFANSREYTEPLLWLDTDEKKQRFINQALRQGLRVHQGGRYLHLSGAGDKGEAMRWLVEEYSKANSAWSQVSIALGDAQNDVPMLDAANYSIVIRSASNPLPRLNRRHNTVISAEIGPVGWNFCLSHLLDELGVPA